MNRALTNPAYSICQHVVYLLRPRPSSFSHSFKSGPQASRELGLRARHIRHESHPIISYTYVRTSQALHVAVILSVYLPAGSSFSALYTTSFAQLEGCAGPSGGLGSQICIPQSQPSLTGVLGCPRYDHLTPNLPAKRESISLEPWRVTERRSLSSTELGDTQDAFHGVAQSSFNAC